jgi:hypothetical protein
LITCRHQKYLEHCFPHGMFFNSSFKSLSF